MAIYKLQNEKIIELQKTTFANEFPEYTNGIIKDYSEAERSRILSVFRPSSKNKVLAGVVPNQIKNQNGVITQPLIIYEAPTI